jgi:UDP-2,3-diacylglucosamine pyrophosphatase LpxH
MREVFLISDLHLGGVQPTVPDSDDRGFRICTHGQDLARFVLALADKPAQIELIINGDGVDFLAEADEGGGWTAFVADQRRATAKLDAIMDRDPEYFRALGTFVAKGHRLTVLLGNHDIELSLPAVRRRFAERLGIDGRHDYQFIYDGEAYHVGRALVEHGNRYDPWNVVDYDALRRVRSLLSRSQPVPDEYTFGAPAGSFMVSDVLNPIKAEYRLIDLLKPETGAALPVLLALEPGYRKVLTRVAALSLKARKHRMAEAALPSFAGDISSTSADTFASGGFASDIGAFTPDGGPMVPAPDALAVVLHEVMKGTEGEVLRAAPPDPGFASDISTFEVVDRTFGLARMLLSSDRAGVTARLPALLAAVRCLQNDTSFARDAESLTEYIDAARDLAKGGFDYVIFGHTHLARDIAMDAGARYLNSGTWADLIRFPSQILEGTERQALDGLRAFVEDLGAGRLRAWTSFIPTYVKLTIGDDGEVKDVVLKDYTSPSDV